MPWDDLSGEVAELFAQDRYAEDEALERWARIRRTKQSAYQAAYIARKPIDERRAMWRERNRRRQERLGRRRSIDRSDPRLEAKRRANREYMQRKRAAMTAEQRAHERITDNARRVRARRAA